MKYIMSESGTIVLISLAILGIICIFIWYIYDDPDTYTRSWISGGYRRAMRKLRK